MRRSVCGPDLDGKKEAPFSLGLIAELAIQGAEVVGPDCPLLDAGLSKADVRKLSRILDLETWDKPQMACLASRIPYSSEITLEKLAAIEKAEELVRGLGYRDVRVRHHGDIARIELGKDEPEPMQPDDCTYASKRFNPSSNLHLL